MNGIDYWNLFRLALPEIVLACAALVVLGVDLGFLSRSSLQRRWSVAAILSGLGCAISLGCLFMANPAVPNLEGMFNADPLTRGVKGALVILTGFVLLVSFGSRAGAIVGELFALILFATTGLMFLASSENLLMLFVALELASLSQYILTAFDLSKPQSAEAALKYYLFGGMSAAITLFGLSFLYGFCGSLELSAVAAAVHAKGMDALLVAGMIMTVIGFGFKVAVAPFHFWAPDVYTGAPTLVAGFIASVSKVASFYILTRILVIGFAGAEGSAAWRHGSVGWLALLAILAALSMVLGNLGAIVQSQVKRLLAYSAIAHAGYMLLAVIACGASGGQPSCLDSLIYYAVTYAITTIGAFGVVAVVEERTGGSSLADFAGLSQRSPILALCMLVFMLSLAGIPPLAGFFGKFFVFTSIVEAGGTDMGLLWLVILGIATSAVSLYYYLQVLKQAYVMPGKADEPPISVPLTCKIGLVLLALLTVVFGIFPELFLKSLRALY